MWERPPGGTRNVISALNFLDWQRENAVFETIAAGTNSLLRMTTTSGPVEVKGGRVSAGYFDLLGVRRGCRSDVRRGRGSPGPRPCRGAEPPILASRFRRILEIVGRAIQLDGEPYTVIGIMPAGGPFDRGWAQLWYPLAFSAAERTRNYHWLRATARLKPGVTFEQAQANMDAIGARIARDYPDSNKDWGVHVDRLTDVLVGSDLRTSLNVLLAAVGLLLLLGCANLANLSLARGTAREREVVVGAALGASRGRILRQFLTESVVLPLPGARSASPSAT